MNHTNLASAETIAKTTDALTANHFSSVVVATRAEALEKIKELIPAGASIMNGSSTTLAEIGLVDYLKEGTHGWDNLHEPIVAESDPEKQIPLRQQAVHAQYYLGSAHAVTEDGELVITSNTGSQLPHLVYTSENIILVVGTHKIVPDLNAAFARINEHVVPLEDKRMQEVYGFGTTYAKTLILHKENTAVGRTVTVIFVNEALGF